MLAGKSKQFEICYLNKNDSLVVLHGILILFKVASWENNPFHSGWLAVKISTANLFPT